MGTVLLPIKNSKGQRVPIEDTKYFADEQNNILSFIVKWNDGIEHYVWSSGEPPEEWYQTVLRLGQSAVGGGVAGGLVGFLRGPLGSLAGGTGGALLNLFREIYQHDDRDGYYSVETRKRYFDRMIHESELD